MDVKKIELAKATKRELEWFVRHVLQLEMDDGDKTVAELRAMVSRAWPQDYIIKPEKSDIYPKQCDSSGQGRPNTFEAEWPEGSGKKRLCCRVVIQKMDPMVYPGGDEPVPVGVNGTAMLIPRGEPVTIPVEYAEVLENAEKFVYSEYDPSSDFGRGGLREPQIVKEYPFSYA